MIEALLKLGIVITYCFGIAMVLTLLWFVIGMMICFYKVYIKKPVINKKTCRHDNYRHTDDHPDKKITCNDCGKHL